jgi:hypothetical protein
MTRASDAQIHIRVSLQFKRAIKVFCAREGLTEQQWVHSVLETALVSQAPDLDFGNRSSVGPAARNRSSARQKVRR